MKRSPLARKAPMPRAKAPLPARSAKRKAHYASEEGKAGLAHMARVRSLPCIICQEWGMRQTTPTETHHVIHGRYGTRKAPDTHTIPLCAEHHRESADPAKVALHAEPSKWKRLHGADHEWLAKIHDMLAGDLTPQKERP